jgi:putative DNA primase/helicase
VPFNLKLKPHEIDRKLPEKLQRELPGIFNWMLAGCEAWINEGLGEVDVVTKATQEYRDDMDTLGKFIEERCDTGNSEAKVPRQHIYDSFKDWCHKNGEVPWSGKVFYKKLRERGYIEIKTNGGIFHNKGIQLYPQYQQPY